MKGMPLIYSLSIIEGTVKPSLMATSQQRPPLYNGHFVWRTVHIHLLLFQPLYKRDHFLLSSRWPLWEVQLCTKGMSFSVKNGIQLFRERLSEKVHATIPKGIVGGFEFTVLQRNLQEWHERPWTYVYKILLKERNNRRFGSYSVRNRLLILSHITFWDCRVHIFSDNLSWNSCIKG